jgi:diadenosine tetraphosphatase ApaH/serine/threonine PP2A family protein phosphatase
LYVDLQLSGLDVLNFRVGGKVDISTDIDLDSNIYNPCYNYCLRICEERLPPTSTILLKIYTRCRRTKELAIVGFCVLNVFVVSGTNQQPATDSSAIPISLNEGKHQIRIKQSLPKLVIGMNASLLDDTPNVPCASLLVRLIHVPSYGHTHSPLTADHEEGQTSSIPDYADGLYDSMTCKPSEGESRLFADMMTRSVLSVRASMSLFGDGIEKRQRDDNGRRQWIAKRLWRLQEDSPVGVDLTYLARYTPRCGIQFSLDSARNLPWSKLTQCIFCFAPPASFYSGLTDDPVSHNKTTDWASPQKCPEWKDGFQYFGRRRVHRYLVVLIHLFAVDVVKRGRMKVADEAWSAVQVFSEGYVYTNRYQLPLFEGKPSKIVFDYLKHYPASTALNDLVGQRKIRLLDGASVFVRIADGRRHEEIPLTHEVNLDYLPDARQSRYTSVHGNQKPLTELIPKDTNQSDYEQKATTQFNELLVLLLNKNKAK